MTYVKKSHTKLYLAIILAIILIGAAAGAAFVILSAPKVAVGVNVGDTFTYSIKGVVQLTGLNAVPSAGFDIYNQTDYYKVTVTNINGTNVSLDTTWRFLNGTELNRPQVIDISNGNKTDSNGFWGLYPANLKISDLLRPQGYDAKTVNNTYSYTYTSGARIRDFWFINGEFSDINDPTGSTLMYDYRNIYFDQTTGILVKLEDIQYFNNPERQETITWTLTNSSVWQV